MVQEKKSKESLLNLNITVVALVALVAIVGLVAIVMNAASLKTVQLVAGSQVASADENFAGQARQSEIMYQTDDCAECKVSSSCSQCKTAGLCTSC